MILSEALHKLINLNNPQYFICATLIAIDKIKNYVKANRSHSNN